MTIQADSSVQFSCLVVSNSLWPYEPQHTTPPCPSPTPGVHPKPCPLSQWCHPTISSSVVHFPSCPQSFRASGSFQMSELSASGGQSIGVSASTSILPMNTQDWYPLGWTSWSSLELYTINCTHFVISVPRFLAFKATSMCEKLISALFLLLNCGVGEDSWESPGLQGDPTSPS